MFFLSFFLSFLSDASAGELGLGVNVDDLIETTGACAERPSIHAQRLCVLRELEADERGPDPLGVSLVGGAMHLERRLTPVEKARLRAQYVQRERLEFGARLVEAPDSAPNADDNDDANLDDATLLLSEFDYNQYDEQIFGVDGRVLVPKPYQYPDDKFVTFVVDRPVGVGRNEPLLCSGVFVSPDEVLTAAHCIFQPAVYTPSYDLSVFHCGSGDTRASCGQAYWTSQGLDSDYGYVCVQGGVPGTSNKSVWHFGDSCEFVERSVVSLGYLRQDWPGTFEAYRQDFAILHLRRDNHPNGLGAGRWMAVSNLDNASSYESKIAVTHGYPAITPRASTNNWYENSFYEFYYGEWWTLNGANQYRTSARPWTSTTNTLLQTPLDAGPSQSGSPIFYYADNATTYSGQAHFIIGLIAGGASNGDGVTGLGDWTGGPTARQFRDFVCEQAGQCRL